MKKGWLGSTGYVEEKSNATIPNYDEKDYDDEIKPVMPTNLTRQPLHDVTNDSWDDIYSASPLKISEEHMVESETQSLKEEIQELKKLLQQKSLMQTPCLKTCS